MTDKIYYGGRTIGELCRVIASRDTPNNAGEVISDLLHAVKSQIPADCDVRKILLRVVPGDGSGQEVYARNVPDVEQLLSEMGERLDAVEGADEKPLATWDDGVGLLWDVYDGRGKWFKRVVSPIGWDAHAVHLHMCNARYASHIDVRLVSSLTNASPDIPAECAAVEGERGADATGPADAVLVSRADLLAIYAAMNHLGDTLNDMDAVEDDDEAATDAGFSAIRRALGESVDTDAAPVAPVVAEDAQAADLNNLLEAAAVEMEQNWGMREDARVIRGMKPGYPPSRKQATGAPVVASAAPSDADATFIADYVLTKLNRKGCPGQWGDYAYESIIAGAHIRQHAKSVAASTVAPAAPSEPEETDMVDQSACERGAFEAWAVTRYAGLEFLLTREKDGYAWPGTNSHWDGWQARAALSTEAPTCPTCNATGTDTPCAPLPDHVYEHMSDAAKNRTSRENVVDVLHALVSAELRAAPSEPAAAVGLTSDQKEAWYVEWPGEAEQTWHRVFINEADALQCAANHDGAVVTHILAAQPASVTPKRGFDAPVKSVGTDGDYIIITAKNRDAAKLVRAQMDRMLAIDRAAGGES
ncbi:hypothetical protein [Pararobbsia silviterrae]|uniref:Uncharacterized protein n=1 Tax=Pararobbsia silviterrae TaxID=1792498 RepID=A0A494X1X8_9BURK|nr:hypothetical protein [Pararobbsia silviterrae]RKP44725.1 hypothetical protein D7S86_27265 [Pararobbsia silviterrae]